jgi:TolA-binding protein
MLPLNHGATMRLRVLSLGAILFLLASLASAQKPSPGPVRTNNPSPMQGPVTLLVNVRDSMGVPTSSPALVRVSASVGSYNVQSSTQDGAVATFPGVAPGDYEIEVRCVSYKSATERLSITAIGTNYTIYIYLQPDAETSGPAGPPNGVVMTPKLQSEIDKGVDAMRKSQFETAKTHFAKAAQMAPANPDVAYLLGTAELALQHPDLARQQFERALTINPSHEKALLSLGELQLRAGDTQSAITTLEKAYMVNGAGWRTHLLLAAAYAKAGKLTEAESHATRAVNLAQGKAAPALLLLGEVQDAEGNHSEAKDTWEQLVAQFPGDSLAATAKQKLVHASETNTPSSQPSVLVLPAAAVPALTLMPVAERPWAPPDIDEKEYPVAPNAACSTDDVLLHARHRMKSQLQNFEKFTATEHIEHQEIDRYGRSGPVRSRDFSYIVFVHTFGGDSMYLEESRNGSSNLSAFPTALATTGLNSLGVSVLQPAYRDSIAYQCQGLANVRGQAAWQLRFVESNNINAGIRRWQRNGIVYNIPVKGRIWIAATTFDVLRIETDLTGPDRKLELTRDHLLVDYGPVSFFSSKTKLWLPWNAEMFMELHGKRYHHKHFLTDYMLFAVDSSNRIAKPNDSPPPSPVVTDTVSP